jgi:hypothetical protein
MLKKQITKILKDYESGSLSEGPQTSTYAFDPSDSLDDYLDHLEEEQRNKQLKYVSATRDEENGHYEVITYIAIPNTDFLLETLSNENVNIGLLRGELERMKKDGLILIGSQRAQQFVLGSRGDFSHFTRGEGWFVETDSIILTTKGKSSTDFLLYQLEEHRFAAWSLFISIAALALSAIALFESF